MQTVSPEVCASFRISWEWEAGIITAGAKYLLPAFKLPNGVPMFRAAEHLLGKEKSMEKTDLWNFKFRKTIATVNKIHSTVERVYIRYSGSVLGKMICSEYLNGTKTFPDLSVVAIQGPVDKNTFIDHYSFDVSALHSDYPYELCDQLMAGEMWPDNKAPKLSDIRFVVSGVDVDAHKAIVCARSPVFAAMFANDMLESGTGCVEITDVSVETFRIFLKFLYTGSLDESCFNEELRYCADKYQVTTLSDLCAGLLVQQDSEKFKTCRRNAEVNNIREDAIYKKEPTIHEECFVIEFVLECARVGSNELRFRNVIMEVLLRSDRSMRFFCWNPNAIGLNIDCVEYNRDGDKNWSTMDANYAFDYSLDLSSYGFPHFDAKGEFPADRRIHFRVSFQEVTENYKFCLVDRLRGSQLWSAATNGQFTDVEFVVAGESFHAHQAIIAARCPTLECLVRENYNQYGMCEINDCGPSIFEQLLYFVYTGSLQAPADNEHLSLLAEKYKIVALQEICEAALRESLKHVDESELLTMQLLVSK